MFEIRIHKIFLMLESDIETQAILKYLKNGDLMTLWKYLLALEESYKRKHKFYSRENQYKE